MSAANGEGWLSASRGGAAGRPGISSRTEAGGAPGADWHPSPVVWRGGVVTRGGRAFGSLAKSAVCSPPSR